MNLTNKWDVLSLFTLTALRVCVEEEEEEDKTGTKGRPLTLMLKIRPIVLNAL